MLTGRVGLVRGLLVIVTAIAVGSFVITQGLDDPASEATAADAGPSTVPQPTITVTPTDTGLTAPSIASPADVSSTEDVADPAGGDTTTDDEATGTDDSSGAIVTGPGDITVLVLNGAGTKGVAGRGVMILDEAGYDTLAPKNATLLGPSKVLYAKGFEEAAGDIAGIFEVDTIAVVVALDPVSPPINDTQGADVIVVIGEDGVIDL